MENNHGKSPANQKKQNQANNKPPKKGRNANKNKQMALTNESVNLGQIFGIANDLLFNSNMGQNLLKLTQEDKEELKLEAKPKKENKQNANPTSNTNNLGGIFNLLGSLADENMIHEMMQDPDQELREFIKQQTDKVTRQINDLKAEIQSLKDLIQKSNKN